MSKKRIEIVTAGIMLSIFLASMESTVVATAMPTIVGQLGGLEHYSWVFSVYMLTSTTTVPLYGKLSDIYGRRKLYILAMGFFLTGSVLSGLANSMSGLIFARALQGLGAGGILPLAFIIIGEIFSLQQRARMQGLFSGVWGVSSIAGPLLGGFLVAQLSWRWVFFVNLLVGPIALGLVVFAYHEQQQRHERAVVDYAGALVLSASVVLLLLGLMDFGTLSSYIYLALAGTLFIALLRIESRAVDPILPMTLFRERLFAIANSHGLLSGAAVFGSISFIPLFVQSVMGTSPLQAGITITPMLLGWVLSSIIGMFIILRVGYRILALIGTSLFAAGALLMTTINADSSQSLMMIFVALMGIGMGLSVPSFLVAVQTSVEKRQLGTATSTLQFSRSIGGTVGVSVMGAALSARLAASGLDPERIQQLLNPIRGSQVALDQSVSLAMANSIHIVFVIAAIAAVLALTAVTFTPRAELKERAAEAAAPSTLSTD